MRIGSVDHYRAPPPNNQYLPTKENWPNHQYPISVFDFKFNNQNILYYMKKISRNTVQIRQSIGNNNDLPESNINIL